ncbi:EF-hand domain-containing protein [Streptomyces sp. NPDC059900]|uniref:EF-hand domain-containing protein n=1 Tax=Streptomyces sp. NPDC059900 TaxID=3155816 RepID=UPI00344237E1
MTDAGLRAKYMRRFQIQDADGDGILVREDIIGRAEILLGGLAESPQSPRGQDVISGAQTYWDGLMKLAGDPGDGRLTEAAFVDALLQAKESGTLGELVRPSVEAHVALIDTDGDGTVSRQEFLHSQGLFGMPEAQAQKAFDAIDSDGDDRLTVEEWQEAVIEAYSTGDEVPGDLVMGLRH